MEHPEMRAHRFPLDDATADRLVAGALDPSDAPPGYAGAARLLADAQGGFGPQPVDERLVGEMVRAISSRPQTDRTPTVITKRRTAKVATLAAAVVLSTAGAAAAAGGDLPAPAQDALSKAASHVGFELPASNDDHPTGNDDNPTERDAHGVEVSDTAHNTEATGRDKGAAISEVARAGHGDHATDDDDDTGDDATTDATDEHGKPADPGSQAPVETPNHGAASGNHPTAVGWSSAVDNPGSDHRPSNR